MTPWRWTLSNKALIAFVVGLILLSVLLVTVWQGLSRTRMAVNEFEGILLPEIRTALGLSDEAAQIVAMAPYLASAGRPFQLQMERQRLNARYDLVFSLSEQLQNAPVRQQIQDNLVAIKEDLDALATLVTEELFIREDLLATQFRVDHQAQLHAESGDVVIANLWQPLSLFFRSITDPQAYDLLSQDFLGELYLASNEPERYLTWLQQASHAHQALQQLDRGKAFLLARLRAHSEQLTQQTNTFAADIQRVVLRQQNTVSEQVDRALAITLGLSLLVMIALLIYYLSNRRLIHDLATVTEDMLHLARGESAPVQIRINRVDEIGDLASAYDTFREHALQAERTSAELATQKTLLETVYNQIQDGLSVFSDDERLVTWNRRYLEIFGFAPQALYVGMPLVDVQLLMSQKPHRNLGMRQEEVDMDQLNRSRHLAQQSFERHFDDGQIIEFRSQPMPNGGFVTLYRELTEHRQAELQLQQAHKLEVLGQLTGGVAHDFNNLLAALSGNLQLLECSGSVSEQGNRYLLRALDVSERGAQLVQRLLAFSRKQQLQPERIELDAFIQDLAELLAYTVVSPVVLTFDLKAPNQCVHIDPSQLENALLNLALNSAAAINGHGCIEVSTRYDAEHERVLLSISDTGIGIPLDLQKRVLEPFFTTRPAGQGSGLGLSTVYGFVKQSGGSFDLQSSPGKGTRIAMSWPVSQAAPVEVTPCLPDRIAFNRHRGIAIVEDDKAVREALTELFRMQGYRVESFEFGEQFLDWSQHQPEPVGLLLSDVNLSGHLNGLDVVTQSKKYWPDTQAVLMSGLPKSQLEEDLGTTIGFRLLQKPITPELFQACFGNEPDIKSHRT